MEIFTSYITLDLNADNAYVTTAAKQGDNNSRAINITVMRDGEKWNVPSTYTAQFNCRKPDGHAVVYNGTIEEDGTITVLLSFQALAAAGNAYASIILYDGEQALSPISFIIRIMAAPDVTDRTDSSSEYVIFVELIQRGERVLSELENWGSEAEAWAEGTRKGFIAQVPRNTPYYSTASFSTQVGTTTQDTGVKKDQNDVYFITIGNGIYYVKTNAIQHPENFHTEHNAKYWAGQAEKEVEDISEYVERAETAAANAEISKTAAAASESAAASSASIAMGSASSANIYALNAATSENNARTYMNNAAASADAAAESETNAEAAAQKLIDLSVSSTTLNPGQEVQVTKTETSGSYNFNFGISTIKPHATVTMHTLESWAETGSATVTVTDVPEQAMTGEARNLQKSFNFDISIPRGKSAYQQAVEGGFQGTNEEFNRLFVDYFLLDSEYNALNAKLNIGV